MVDKTAEEFKAIDDLQGGDVYIGCAESFLIARIARKIKRFKEKYPLFHYHIISGDRTVVLDRLDRGLLDIFAKQILKFKPMLCKYLRSSLKTVRRTVFSPDGVALSSNLSSTASQVKQKEQAEACSFCLAGVERFELPDDGVRGKS